MKEGKTIKSGKLSRRPEHRKYGRIGLLTGGGDAPGLNAVIRAVVKTARNFNTEVTGILDGFEGLLPPLRVNRMDPHDISGIIARGGTILGTSNRGNFFPLSGKAPQTPETQKASAKIIAQTKRAIRKLELDCIICIGGEGTLTIANNLNEAGIPCVGCPKTIDNDLPNTYLTFGFDTAVSIATDALDKLHTTASSHHRVLILEVMGRYCGWIALHSGIAGGADVILIPEIPFNYDSIVAKIRDRDRRKKGFSIIVVAEGAKPEGGEMVVRSRVENSEVKLGGIGQQINNELSKRLDKEVRLVVLGHLQRGGNPTTFDRLLATRLGAKAALLALEGKFGMMASYQPPDVKAVPLCTATSGLKYVDPNSELVQAARNLGISFGDEKVKG